MSAALIAKQWLRLREDFSLYPVTASELEFYLEGAEDSPALEDFWRKVSADCADKNIGIYKTEKESGKNQFEVALQHGNDPVKTAADTALLKEIITSAAGHYAWKADFSARPFADRPGSGLHIHVHLADKQGRNIFYKDDETISGALQYSIGGLMAWLNPCMIVFAPHADSYGRFVSKSNAPMTVSWGANNRTVAIRLPDTAHDNKRIEHRAAGADADPALVMAVILAAMHYGLKNKCDPGMQIFGDAALAMYGLPPIITTRDEAVERLHKATLFDSYFTVLDLLSTP